MTKLDKRKVGAGGGRENATTKSNLRAGAGRAALAVALVLIIAGDIAMIDAIGRVRARFGVL